MQGLLTSDEISSNIYLLTCRAIYGLQICDVNEEIN